MKRKDKSGERFHYIIYQVLKITQSEFAEMLGVSRTQVNAYVKGNSFPGDDVMQKLQSIGINPRFIEYSDEPKIFANNENGERLKKKFIEERYNLLGSDNTDDQIDYLNQKVEKLENFIREKFVDYNNHH